jgi:hypothetical protein
MNALRRAHALTRFMLVWMVLTVFGAIASPLIKPQAMTLLCSAAGTVKLVQTDEQGVPTAVVQHTLDCPACLHLLAPPPAVLALAEPVAWQASALPVAQATEVRPQAARSSPEARAPPIFFV